jgi:hypothetical protein
MLLNATLGMTCILLACGLVQAPAHAESAAVATDAPSADASAAKPSLADHQLPKLVLSWNCGPCEPNPKVLPLIEQEYTSHAAAAGFTISDSETAEVVITEYHQRPPGARVSFGVLAGKDVLGTRVTFRQKAFVVRDYYANAWHGMNGLCAVVSKKIVAQLTVVAGQH